MKILARKNVISVLLSASMLTSVACGSVFSGFAENTGTDGYLELDRTGMTATACTQYTDYICNGDSCAQAMLDGNENSWWHTDWNSPADIIRPEHPYHWVNIDLNGAKTISKITYLPRNTQSNGRWLKFDVIITDENDKEVKIIENGTFDYVEDDGDFTSRDIVFDPVTAKSVKILITDTDGQGGVQDHADCAELYFYGPANPIDSLKSVIAEAKKLNADEKTTQAKYALLNAIAKAEEVLAEAEETGDDANVETAAKDLRGAIKTFNDAAEAVKPLELDRADMSAEACSQYTDKIQDGDACADAVLDNNVATWWHTDWRSPAHVITPDHPHWITVDLGGVKEISQITYQPRANQANGRWLKYNLIVTDENGNEITVIENGDMGYTEDEKDFCYPSVITFDPIKAKSFKFVITDTDGDSKGDHAACSELYVYAPAPVEKPLATFEVISDTHVSGTDTNSGNYRYLTDAIEDIKKQFPDTSAIINCGDIADYGNEEEMSTYFGLLGEYVDEFSDDFKFINALGNHDIRWKSGGYDEVYERYMRLNKPFRTDDSDNIYYDEWINGCHFIVMNTEWDTKDRWFVSDEQLQWLREKIAENNEDGSKPVFVIAHPPLRDSFEKSSEWGGIGVQDYKIKEVLRDYPNTFLFTGHIHATKTSTTVLPTDFGYMVDVPSIPYSGQIGYHVSVYSDRVEFSLYDYANNKVLSEYDKVAQLPNPAAENGKVLDVNFDNETADDRTDNGNNGTVVGDVEYVEGYTGKAVHIVNDGTGKAQQYIDFGDVLKLDDSDVTIMFNYKAGEKTFEDQVIFGNVSSNDADAGYSFKQTAEGIDFSTGDGAFDSESSARYQDGKWHNFAVTIDRDGKAIYYADGKKVSEEDVSSAGISLDADGKHLILGADADGNCGVKDAYFDDVKIYRHAILESEMTIVYNPFTITTGVDSATLEWDSDYLDYAGHPLAVDYVVINRTQKIEVSDDVESFVIEGLEPGTEYDILAVTHELDHPNNLQDAYQFKITTKQNAYELGDVNHDSKIDINDATLVQQYCVKMKLENFDAALADLNNDGRITVTDATIIGFIATGIK